MATLAQDESRKTSARVKCGQQTSMEKGVVYGNGKVLLFLDLYYIDEDRRKIVSPCKKIHGESKET